MNIRIIGNYVGQALRVEWLFMIPALILAIVFGEWYSAIGFAVTIIALVLMSFGLSVIKVEERTIYTREGFVIVALSWISMSIFGALPFFISGAIPNYIDCIFETVSGFTTTGASVLRDVEALPKSLLYWRSFTNWLGGMGAIVFLLAISPKEKTKGSLRILRAESPGPIVGKLVPKIRSTALLLYKIYIALTVLEMIMLVAGGMPVFESVCHSFSTAGTGGFSVKNASIGAYDSDYIQIVIGVFMLLFGINFNVFYLLLIRKVKQALFNQELRLYLGIAAFSVAAVTINTLGMFENAGEALKHSFFQVSSIITTTGFATTDFNLWPEFSKCLLVVLMVFGACAGSTAGGIKMARLLILLKSFRNTIQRMIHPRSVKIIKIDGEIVEESTVREVTVFMTAYVMIFGASLLAISLDNFDFETTVTSVVATLNNVGPGLGGVGPTSNFADFSVFSKIILSLNMLIGRLEIFPMLMLVAPSLWKREK